MISLLDISSVQGIVTPSDWKSIVARGTRAVVAKCGNGNDPSDWDFQRNIATARAAGLVVGAYHFPFALHVDPRHPGRDPIDQAHAHFDQCAELGSVAGDLTAFCDAEWPRPEGWNKPVPGIDSSNVDADFLRAFFLEYMGEYSSLQGRPMGIYGDPWFLKSMRPSAEYAKYPLWIAAYGEQPSSIFPWAGYCAWQTSGGGARLPDGAPVDTDVVPDEATFAMLRGLPTPTVP